MSGTAVARKSKSVAVALESPSIKKRLNELLGKRATSFCSTLVAISRSSDMLAKADPSSVIGAAITAATLDLPINPNLGFAYVVPYGKEAQFQIGWKGIVQLALRTGKYEKMVPFKVNKEAFISFNPLTEELEVDLTKLNQESEDIVGYGFYFKLVNGFEKTVYWSRERCEAHGKKYSQTFKRGFGVWVDNFDAMALKTVVKLALSQFGILSVDMQDAIEKDQSVSSGIDGEGLDYADNKEGEQENPLDTMEPATDVKEEAPAAEEAPEADAKEEAETEEKTEAAAEVDETKLLNSLEILQKHRPEDFSNVCADMNIPVERWQSAPIPYLEDMLKRLNA